jgi:YegS/Rv2252/BmrU family lipid kinase
LSSHTQIRKVRFIVNPISGATRNTERIIELVNKIWEGSEIEYEVRKTAHRGNATELAREAVVRQTDMVVAVGGDGTINEVGRGLIGSDVILGVIPTGSGNGFARNFNIPLKIRKSIELLKRPGVKRIDVGKINDHYFFNVAGIGLDAEICAHFERFGFRGPLPYFMIGIREFFRYRPQPVMLHLNGHTDLHFHPIVLSIANGPQYGNGAIIAPHAKPDDGVLDFCVLSSISILKALVNTQKLFNGNIDQLSEMKIYQSATGTIQREKEGYIHTDGDHHLERGELKIEVLPAQLNLAVSYTDDTSLEVDNPQI